MCGTGISPITELNIPYHFSCCCLPHGGILRGQDTKNPQTRWDWMYA